MQYIRLALAAWAVALAVATGAAAQESINYASVSGRVTDGQGGVVPGATVTARHLETDVAASVLTDTGGRYRFQYLRVGAYQLTVQLAGFATAERRVALSVGAAFEIPFVLAIEGLETRSVIDGTAPAGDYVGLVSRSACRSTRTTPTSRWRRRRST